jgi:hypothetical protein
MTKIWKHDELQEDLAAHLRASTDRICWTNIQMGPSGTYRPDVFCIPKSYAHFHPVVYEVKVSLSDFRSDITSGKWQNYLKVAQAVIFAMPAGFINKQDVPAGCGLIIRYESGWKMVKKPTMNALETLPRDAWLKLLITGIERETQRQEPRLEFFNKHKAQEAVAAKWGKNIGKLLGDLESAERNLQYQIDETWRKAQIEEEKRKQSAKTRIADDELYSELKKELCDFLGIDANTPAFMMRSKIRGLIDSLSKDDEIQRLNKVIYNIKHAVDNATMTDEKFGKIGKLVA